MVLSLAQAVELALIQNLDVESSQVAARQAQARIDGARGPFDPILNVYASHGKRVRPTASELDALISQSITDVVDTTLTQKLVYGATYEVKLNATRSESNNPFFSVNPSYATDALLKYTQPLLEGLGRNANLRFVREAINNSRIAGHGVEIRARDVVRDTIHAYWDLVFAREDLEVKQASLRLAEDLERQNRIMVEVGTLAPLEIAQAEAAVATRKQDIIITEASIGSAEDAIRRLIGADRSSHWWRGPIVPAEAAVYRDAWVDLTESLATAASRRPELNSADLEVENARLALAQAKDALLPTLTFEGTISTAGLAGDRLADKDGDTVPDTFIDKGFSDAYRQVGDREFNSWSASLNLNVPLRNRAAEADFQVARLDVEDRLIGVERTRQTVTLEVRQAVRDVESARERIQAAQSSRTLQQKKMDAEIKKFENGLSTNFEVLTFQTDLATARSNELRAIVDYLKALAALDAARGTLLSQGQLALAWE